MILYQVTVFVLFIPSPTKLRRDIVTLPSVRQSHPCEHSRINILQWILTKLGTYLVLKRIWNPDLDLWPWKSIGLQILLRTKYVPSLVKIHWRMLILECSQGCYTVENLPSDLDLCTLGSTSFNGFWPSLVHI
jgi:hypothetical protein